MRRPHTDSATASATDRRRRTPGVLVAVAALSAIPAAAAADGLVLYSEQGFRGDTVVVTQDLKDFARLRGWNDRAASLEVHDGLWEVCLHAGWRDCKQIGAGAKLADLGRIGQFRGISSVRRLDWGTAHGGGHHRDDRQAGHDRQTGHGHDDAGALAAKALLGAALGVPVGPVVPKPEHPGTDHRGAPYREPYQGGSTDGESGHGGGGYADPGYGSRERGGGVVWGAPQEDPRLSACQVRVKQGLFDRYGGPVSVRFDGPADAGVARVGHDAYNYKCSYGEVNVWSR